MRLGLWLSSRWCASLPCCGRAAQDVIEYLRDVITRDAGFGQAMRHSHDCLIELPIGLFESCFKRTTESVAGAG
jgi:hypothetical protein